MSRTINDSIYRVRLFKEKYLRNKCRKCGAYFWSIKAREDCNDAPCSDYTFFNIPVKRVLSYRDTKNIFLGFFNRYGHEIIEPRPVVARWREDLYLTIASIVVFQPHVTSGLVPPPANPLVIAQPCIRLEDIDSVGLTIGRHLTNFIMGGHHAFNYKDKHIYWTDETVEYAKQFFVEEIGVPEEEIVFKESWWEGGGNAGPCFEVAIGGLEVATLVFMMYRVDGSNYVEMPLKIVDTGYGIERIAWFTQKTPTAFHAVYEDLVGEFHRLLNIPEPDREILYEFSRRAGKIKPDDPTTIDIIFVEIGEAMGVKRSLIEDQIRPVFDLYAILDHTKTISLMLSDGIVPSNSGEGYLARLVIRRVLRRLSRLRNDVPLIDLVNRQLNFWGDMYPRMIKNRERIKEIIELEEEKYRETLSRVSTVASRYSKRSPTIEDLVELYDSYGIPPDVISSELKKRYGVVVEVPQNFYSIVASKHSRPKIVREKEYEIGKLPEYVINWASKFPETRRIFHEDSYQRVFKAKVLGVLDKRYVVLDSTAFYPEGGGQIGDKGVLIAGSKSYRVVETRKIDGVVVHIVDDGDGISENMEVIGEIDWGTRYRRMRHHTATHILLGALRRVLGEHIWQAGAEKTEFKARLDVTHYKLPSNTEIKEIERLANNVVDSAIDVRISYLPKNTAENLYGFTLYQGGVPLTPVIRVVEIPNWDAEACFGTHVRNTSEVGGIKIVNVEKIADGVVRFEYVVATALVEHVRGLEERLKDIADKIGASMYDVSKRVDTLTKELSNLKNMLRMYREKYVSELLQQIADKAVDMGLARFHLLKLNMDDKEMLRELLVKAVAKEPRLAILAIVPQNGKTYIEVSLGSEAQKNINAKDIVSEISKYTNIRAGGKKDHVTGIIESDIDAAEKIIQKAIQKYRK
ncbi:MAG: alanine--tRNA ligase [Ignisphaera sp.]|uniref:Alanine--tRNA ligase n=1 Tax=Ignisphaera aggregans TaxID=334771 RepID=A0A7J3I763_9CREN